MACSILKLRTAEGTRFMNVMVGLHFKCYKNFDLWGECGSATESMVNNVATLTYERSAALQLKVL